MGGFSGSNPLVRVGAAAVDAYTGVPVASTALAVNDARGQQQAQKSQATAQQQAFDLQASALQRQQQQQVQDRNDLLKHQLSAQRARLSAMGIGGGGSSDALMAGLTQQAAFDVANIEGDFGDRIAALDLRRQQSAQSVGSGGVWSSMLAPVAQSLVSKSDDKKRQLVEGGAGGFNLL